MSSVTKSESVRVIDCTIFNGDPIIEMRIPYLYNHVDEFVIVEARETHSGAKKDSLYIDSYRAFLAPFMNKITILVIEQFPEPSSIHFNGIDREAWSREHYQRDFAYNSYVNEKYSNEKYILLCCDMDEIPRQALVSQLKQDYAKLTAAVHLDMVMFKYSFRWHRSGVKWTHPFAVSDRVAAKHPLSKFRTGVARTIIAQNAGWHCTYFYTIGDMIRKLESFAHSEFDKTEYKSRELIRSCMLTGRFFLSVADGKDDKLQPYYGSDLPTGWMEFQQHMDDMIYKEDLSTIKKM